MEGVRLLLLARIGRRERSEFRWYPGVVARIILHIPNSTRRAGAFNYDGDFHAAALVGRPTLSGDFGITRAVRWAMAPRAYFGGRAPRAILDDS